MSPLKLVCVECGRSYVLSVDERLWRDRAAARLCIACQVAAAHERPSTPGVRSA
ncbi:MAG TPA: hypothetical protein VG370_01680 [Chloroflexota bacterium]|nr:hypothetical protein [Chloroflexota bacterium]